MERFAEECLALAPPPVAALDERAADARATMIGASLTFPLVSRRRLIGLAFGSMHGARRGSGSDIAGSRPYVPGDDPHRIDWGVLGPALRRARAATSSSSASTSPTRRRASSSASTAARDVAVPARAAVPPQGRGRRGRARADRGQRRRVARPRRAARARRGADVVGWCPPTSGRRHARARRPRAARARRAERTASPRCSSSSRSTAARSRPRASSSSSPTSSSRHRSRRGSGRSTAAGTSCPVVVQDPVWEQGFPDVDRLVVPLVGSDGRVRPVRLADGESQAWRERHEARLASSSAACARSGSSRC